MNIALITCIPITALVVGFLVLKGVQLGLKWQYQIKNEEQPTMDIRNPISEVIQTVQQNKPISGPDVLDEYLNGAKE